MMRTLMAEGLGTGLLLMAVIGSGIYGETLSQGNTGVALLANAIATGCMLFVLITCLGPISGAHFNPAVSLAFYLRGHIPLRTLACYVPVQIIGGVLGVWLTHGMYDTAILQFSTTDRTGPAQWLSEIVATFGLLFVIFGGLRFQPGAIPALVGLYITGAYWFTASTSFANPAVTIARLFSDTFAGINPAHVTGFIFCQIIGVGLAHFVLRWLFSPDTDA
ncbi:MAG: MIP/aquaporin family protein [Pseudomonadota bacterium]